MASRLDLHNEFIDLLGTKDEKPTRVYFQPPPSVLMKYDAIRYKLTGKSVRRANNKAYNIVNEYEGVIITLDPDTSLPDMLLARFEMCSVGRPYVSEGLYHYPFTLYY